MKKESQVIMLPTDKAQGCIIKHEGGLGMGYIKGFHSQGYLKGNNETSHHLYFTTDEGIKEGDWYIDDANQVRQAVTSDLEYWETRKEYKKINLERFIEQQASGNRRKIT